MNCNFEIWILGDGPLNNVLNKHIVNLQVEEYVKLLGRKLNPYPYVKAADAFVLTSSQEGFSIVIAEAMILGKPIISTKVTGPTELLDNSKYGILIDQDINDICKSMLNIMNETKLRLHYSEKSLERSMIFNPAKTMSQLYAIFSPDEK